MIKPVISQGGKVMVGITTTLSVFHNFPPEFTLQGQNNNEGVNYALFHQYYDELYAESTSAC